MEDAGKFTGDEAGAHDHHLAGQLPLQKQVIAHPAQLGAGDGGPLRPAAHGDQDSFANQLLSGAPWLGSPWGRPFGSAAQPTGDLNRMGIDKPSPAADQGHPRLGEQVPVQLVEPIHFRGHVGQQHRWIAAGRAHLPAVAGRIAQAVAKA